MSLPLYYLHHARPYTEGWRAASLYRINTSQMLRILDYYSGHRSAEQLALEIIGNLPLPPLNDALVWSREHASEARQAHSHFHPATTRLQPGLIVNAKHPWLAHTPDDLTWGSEGVGLTLYKAPYTKTIPREPLAAHELQLCYAAAVCEWSRPLIDYVVWTPSASSIKRYTPETILVSRESLSLRQLWDSYVWPRLSEFQSTVLQPLISARDLNIERIYGCPLPEYVAVRDPNTSVATLSAV